MSDAAPNTTAQRLIEPRPTSGRPPTGDIVVVANRLPVRRTGEGEDAHWQTSPGGLVSALMPILQRTRDQGRGGVWVGWSGDTDAAPKPFHHDGVLNAPVPLTAEQLDRYYEGMANSTLWPLYHDAVRRPHYRRSWWRAYQQVNQLFADSAARHAAQGATVWVHDYQLHLVPRMLRELRPDLRIGFFLHIPFPGRGLFAQLPWRQQIIEGTLGADAVGFQTRLGAQNFKDLARWYAGARSTATGVDIDGRSVVIDAFPISIDAAHFDALARDPDILARRDELRKRLGRRRVVLGVDRMDYTKGIAIRLHAFQDMLARERISADEVVMIQLGVPTRERVEEYKDLRSEIEELVGQINGQFGDVGNVAVQYLRQSLPPEQLVALYLLADVMLVTPLRDGMNLVAKEYVACRHNLDGALVLSEFAGAASELNKAFIVNPYDLDALEDALLQALNISPEDARRRMRSMRRVVFRHDVFAWADSFLSRLMDG